MGRNCEPEQKFFVAISAMNRRIGYATNYTWRMRWYPFLQPTQHALMNCWITNHAATTINLCLASLKLRLDQGHHPRLPYRCHQWNEWRQDEAQRDEGNVDDSALHRLR